jgi:diguanylate cyclase (GGDEF)-like protein/PAS domain S-box-containing protein
MISDEFCKEKILLVDDNQQNRTLMLAILSNDNREILLAESGQKALELLTHTAVDLIIMDVQMPGLNGFETIERMKKSGLNIRTPIVFITSHSQDDMSIDLGFEMGAYDYIFRPIDINLLRLKVAAILKVHRRHEELSKTNETLINQLASALKKQQFSTEMYFTDEAFENNLNGLVVVDKNLNYLRVNKAFTQITGYTTDELIGKTPSLLKSGIQSDQFYKDMWTTLNSTGAWQGELWNRNKNNELYAEWLTINAVMDSDNTVSHYIGVVSDITGHKQFQERLVKHADFDCLTTLPNRRNFLETLKKNIRNVEEKKVLSVFFLDLNKFKAVNDNFGHKVGDELLAAVAKRLQRCVRQNDVVARLGGDEFVIMANLDQDSFTGTAKTIAEKIIMALTDPFNLSNNKVHISTSIGIACYPHDGKDAETLITHADLAMYQSKKQGYGQYHFFDSNLEG